MDAGSVSSERSLRQRRQMFGPYLHPIYTQLLELPKRLRRRLALRHPQYVEPHRLRQWPALPCQSQFTADHAANSLTDGHNVTQFYPERG